jgi:hypothetical protein
VERNEGKSDKVTQVSELELDLESRSKSKILAPPISLSESRQSGLGLQGVCGILSPACKLCSGWWGVGMNTDSLHLPAKALARGLTRWMDTLSSVSLSQAFRILAFGCPWCKFQTRMLGRHCAKDVGLSKIDQKEDTDIPPTGSH